MKAVILAGGRGSRLYPIGMTQVKALVKILNKPIILWNLEALQANGINQVVVVISPDQFGEALKKYLSELNLPNLQVEFAVQEKQLGTANALQAAQPFLENEDEFLYFNGDDLYAAGLVKQLIEHKGLVALGKEMSDPRKYGVFQVDVQSHLVKLIEKPESLEYKLARIGGEKLSKEIFNQIPQVHMSPRKEYEVTDAITLLAQQIPITVVKIEDYWLPVGYPWEILDVNAQLVSSIASKIEGEVEANVTIKGKLVLPKSSKILANTYIDGNLVVGENSVIGPNVSIRDTVVIGDHCSVLFGSEIKNSAIGNDNRISNSYVGDSVFGNNINFPYAITANYLPSVPSGTLASQAAEKAVSDQGIVTLVKNKLVATEREKLGAIIGDNVNIGARTIIYPGVKIWSNASTAPGEIVKRDIVNEWQ